MKRRGRQVIRRRRTSNKRRRRARLADNTRSTMDYFFIGTSLLKIVCLLAFVLGLMNYAVYAERRVSALIQDRLGPNRVGPAGLLQPLADAGKFLLKDQFTPAHVNKLYYFLAPCLAMIPPITTLAVGPFGSTPFRLPM